MEILKKNKKEMLATVTEMKNAFNELVCTPDTTEERISRFVQMSIGTSKSEKQKEQGLKKTNRILKGCETMIKSVT